jgi:sec-independent protein translocase protein TatB
MFDVGFSELLIIAVVALLVLGPERLPKAARFAGLWMRRARAQWYSVKAELERELASEEMQRSLKNPLADLQPQMQSLEADVRKELDGLDPTKSPMRAETPPLEAPPLESPLPEPSAEKPPLAQP